MTRSAAKPRVHPGDTLLVRLQANGGAGNAWRLAQSNILLLRSLDTDAAGTVSGDQQTFRFLVVGIGGEQILFQYGDTQIAGGTAAMFQTLVVSDPLVAPKSGETVVRVTDNDNGAHVPLRVGDTLALRLAVSTGSGYHWDIGLNNATLLKPTGSITDRFANIAMGGLQYQEFSFRASKPGSEKLQLFQRRGTEQSEQTFSVQVFVGN